MEPSRLISTAINCYAFTCELVHHREDAQECRLSITILESIDFEHALGEKAREASRFFRQLLDALDLGDALATVGVAPAVESSFGNAVFATNFSNGLCPLFGLCQDANDVFSGMRIGLRGHTTPLLWWLKDYNARRISLAI